MPLIQLDPYYPPRWLFNNHFETIYPAVFRKIKITKPPQTIALSTTDNDLLEVDYYENYSDKTAIISHGLEGNSKRPYVLGMANALFTSGWNVIAWNYRGCNGKPNNTLRSYHSGFTEDLEVIVQLAKKPEVKSIVLVGFSLGGNLTLKYLGDKLNIPEKIQGAVVYSVPVDLHKACLRISDRSNRIYSQRFLKSLKQKIREKAIKFPEIETRNLRHIKDLLTFDDVYTAPLHGFKDAVDYYEKCSALYVLEKIQHPVLLVNAMNDPFLPESCYPLEIARNNQYINLAMPKRGGHVGFTSTNNDGVYWSERAAIKFISTFV